MSEEQRAEAYTHIRAQLPFLSPLIAATAEIDLPKRNGEPVADALVRIVAGQMLSRSAAQSILARMNIAAQWVGCGPLHRLPESELRACGLSGRKAKTIALISEMASTEAERLESWRALPFDELRREVSSVWGLSDWSASVLGIFHFGQPDVFPMSDGSLVRAIRLIEQQMSIIEDRLAHEAAAPFRSYLALTFWAALDHGHLVAAQAAK